MVFVVLRRKVFDLKVSYPPEGPFDLNSPSLVKDDIYFSVAYWWQFYIPTDRVPDFCTGDSERGGIHAYKRIKARECQTRKRKNGEGDDEAAAQEPDNVCQSEKVQTGQVPTTKEVRISVIFLRNFRFKSDNQLTLLSSKQFGTFPLPSSPICHAVPQGVPWYEHVCGVLVRRH